MITKRGGTKAACYATKANRGGIITTGTRVSSKSQMKRNDVEKIGIFYHYIAHHI